MSPSFLPLLAALATAQPTESHQALYLQARTAESEHRWAEAVAACTGAIEANPTGPRTPTCRERLAWLQARRDPDGSFRGLTALQGVRRDYRTLAPDEAVRRVVPVAEDPGVAELVRTDARVWLARDALERRNDPEAALAWTAPVLAEHTGPLRASAVGLHARALATLGRGAEALEVEAEIRVDPVNKTRRTPAETILFEQRTALAARVSAGVIALFALVSAPLAWRHGRGQHPVAWIPLLVLAGGAGLIAEQWAEGAGAATPWMALGFVGVNLLAGPALRPLTGWRRVGVAGLAACATAATTVLALVLTDTLDWVLP